LGSRLVGQNKMRIARHDGNSSSLRLRGVEISLPLSNRGGKIGVL
jgi:hypothetical protein